MYDTRRGTDEGVAVIEEQTMRALIGVVERAARSPYAKSLVLRGGLAMRPAEGPLHRTVEDVDFLGLPPLDVEAGPGALVEIVGAQIDDGIRYDGVETETIWEESETPGVRARALAHIDGQEVPVQIDLSFGDPRVVPDRAIKLEGQTTPIQAAAVETIYAWKVHGLFERGHGQWRPKDLFDLWILSQREDLDESKLPEALRATFDSHGDSFAIMDRFLGGPWGTSSGSREKWRKYVESRDDVPKDMQEVVTEIRTRVIPIVAAAVDA